MPPANTNKHKSCSALLHRSARSTPLTLKGARGNWLKVSDDIETWEVFDGSGGASVSNIGHKQYRVMQAQWDYFDSTGIAYAPSTSLQTEIAEEFAQFMLESTNHEMAKVVFYGSGTSPRH
jgi:4-aminobutyrate aminotransferase-like enzyme